MNGNKHDPEETMRRAEEAVARACTSPTALGRRPPGSFVQRGMGEEKVMSQMAMSTAVSIPRGKLPQSSKVVAATKAFATSNGTVDASMKPMIPPRVGVGRTVQQRSFHTPTTQRANPAPGTAEIVKSTSPPNTNRAISATSAPNNLDLKHNDDAFHVVANLILDRLLRKVQPRTTEYSLDDEDRIFLDEMIPNSVRHAFVDALRYRTRKAGGEQNNLIAKLAGQCCMLGLDRNDEENILLNRSLKTAKVARGVVGSNQGSSTISGGSAASIPLEEKEKILGEKERLKEKQSQLQQQKLSAQAEQIRMQAEQIKRMKEAVTTQLLKEKAMKEKQEAHLKEQQEALIEERMLKAQQDRLLEEQLEILEKEKTLLAGELPSTMVAQGTSLLDEPGLNQPASGQDLNISTASASRTTPGGDLLISSEAQASATESMARMQIMTEIKEATTLMNESVSIETANFWKAHIEELQNRLMLMNKELPGNNSLHGGGGGDGGVINQLQSQEEVRAHYGKESQTHPSHDEYLDGNRKMAEGYFGHQSQQISIPISGTNNVSNTRDLPLANAELVNDTYVEMRSLEGMSKAREESSTEGGAAPLVDVVSPADLPEGYVFEAQLGSKKFLATVPAGGVKRGAMFSCPMSELDVVEIDVPRGQWKDSIFDCFQEGFFHALFCSALFLPHLALGQIMSRNQLNSLGSSGTRFQSKTAFTNMMTFAIFWIAMNMLAGFALYIQWNRGFKPTLAEVIGICVFNIVLAACTVLIVSRTRQSIREKYELPEIRCHGHEDIICATFCMPCTICQLGRHTADYDTYRATCCTETGLPRHVKLKQIPTNGYPDHGQFA